MHASHPRRTTVRLLVLLGAAGLMAGTVAGTSAATSEPAGASITVEPFGTIDNPDSPSDGLAVDLYTLTNGAGMEVTILTYGGTIQSIQVPDRDGTLANVTLGFDNLDQYVNQSPYFGNI